MSEREKYPLGRDISSFCFFRNTHPTRLSNTSVFCVMCLVELGKNNIVYGISKSFNASNAPNILFFYMIQVLFDDTFVVRYLPGPAIVHKSAQMVGLRCKRLRGILVSRYW